MPKYEDLDRIVTKKKKRRFADSLHLNYFYKAQSYETGIASCICNELANSMKHYL